LPNGQIDVKIITLIALAMMVFGPMAAATTWSSGSYGFDSGSVTWATTGVSSGAVTQLGGATSQASTVGQTASAVGLGNNSIQVSQEETAATVQLGSGSSSSSAQAPASGTVQLSGYFDNMGSYTNVYYPTMMLGGTFSSSGGGCGCGCG
jgi:hypothetical protein